MKIQTSIICAVLAFGIVAPTGAEDCYKQLMYSLCTGPGTVLNWGDLCRTWTDKGYTCDEQPSLEQNVTSYLPDPARLQVVQDLSEDRAAARHVLGPRRQDGQYLRERELPAGRVGDARGPQAGSDA
jgi:hypothetical protein